MSGELAVRPRRPMSRFERAAERFAASRPGTWLYLHVFPRIDPFLLRRSNGRISSGIGYPVALLETVGAKSGKERANPLLYLADGDNIVFVASKGGSPSHPGWYHNIKANPDVHIIAKGRTGDYRAREAEGEEREELWAKVTDLYAGYDVYQRRAPHRRIPIVVCERKR